MNSVFQLGRPLQRENDFVRPPSVAGLFYPSEKAELEESVRVLMRDAKKDVKQDLPERIFGIISPHAGYAYSGYTAAHAYSLLQGKEIKTIVVVSPSHREYFEGVSVFPGKAYSTPLGKVEIDSDFRDGLLESSCGLVEANFAGHRTEHAVEVQLPFLQVILGKFKLVPLVMGDQKPEYCRNLGKSLSEVVGEDTLIVASSDLSHYYDYESANKIDQILHRAHRPL